MPKGTKAGTSRGSAELRAREQDRLRLLGLIAEGDQDALASFYDSTNRQVFGLILRILGDSGSAEEVTLEVYAQIWRQAGNYNIKRGTPSAWLLTIARSRAIDRLRSGAQERKRAEPLEAATELSASGASPEESASEAERRILVRAALDELPVEQRQVIELAYFHGLSHSEIAAQLSQPLGTVKTRVRLAMNRLRDALRLLQEGTDT